MFLENHHKSPVGRGLQQWYSRVIIFLNKRPTCLFKQIESIIEILSVGILKLYLGLQLENHLSMKHFVYCFAFHLVNGTFLEGETNFSLNKSVNF